jgi:hypothetical protein
MNRFPSGATTLAILSLLIASAIGIVPTDNIILRNGPTVVEFYVGDPWQVVNALLLLLLVIAGRLLLGYLASHVR